MAVPFLGSHTLKWLQTKRALRSNYWSTDAIIVFIWNTSAKEVQIANFGHELTGRKDVLQGYVVSEVEITDKRVLVVSGKMIHPILRFTGNQQDEVEGTVFEITDAELAQTDDYEVADYTRVAGKLKSGKVAWLYAAKVTGLW